MDELRAATNGFDIMRVGRNGLTPLRRAKAGRIAFGGALFLAGFVPRGWLRGAMVFSGAYLVLREIARDKLDRVASNRPRASERDSVDEASWESFPASDPPGF